MDAEKKKNEKQTDVPWVMFALIGMTFLLGYDYHYSLRSDFDASLGEFVEMAASGNWARRIAIPLLALVSFVGLMRKGVSQLSINGNLGLIILLYYFWCYLSVLWSLAPLLTLKRLMVLVLYSVIALSLASRYSMGCIPKFVVFFSAISFLLGLVAEINLGTFRPLAPDYRFAGMVHPNVQGFACAMMFMAATSLALNAERMGPVFLFIALSGLVGIVLAKSRTPFASAIAAQTVFCLWRFKGAKRLALILGLAYVLTLLLLIVGPDLISGVGDGILLGRTEKGISNFSGRTFIWGKCWEYLMQRPLHGYGFNSFWTVDRIKEISHFIGMGLIGAHSAYIDLALGIGFVGLILYLSLVLSGCFRALRSYTITGDPGYAFHFKLSVFFLFHAVLESGTIQVGFGSMVWIWGLFSMAYGKPAIPVSPRGQEGPLQVTATLPPLKIVPEKRLDSGN